jgi:hypothetical protein
LNLVLVVEIKVDDLVHGLVGALGLPTDDEGEDSDHDERNPGKGYESLPAAIHLTLLSADASVGRDDAGPVGRTRHPSERDAPGHESRPRGVRSPA